MMRPAVLAVIGFAAPAGGDGARVLGNPSMHGHCAQRKQGMNGFYTRIMPRHHVRVEFDLPISFPLGHDYRLQALTVQPILRSRCRDPRLALVRC